MKTSIINGSEVSRLSVAIQGVVVRKVDIRGKLSLRGVSLSAGKAFRNERLGLKETQEDCSGTVNLAT